MQVHGTSGSPPWTPRPLSRFDNAKAEWLLRNRLPCLGCHELGGEGGRIGPSLSNLKGRRVPDDVYSMIRDPRGGIMPRVPMSPATLDLVASYLVQREPASSTPAPLPPAPDHPKATSSDMAADLYQRYCAPCHGGGGRGDGYNAPYLPVRPTAHSDKTYMSGRSDDALFDAIYAGGYIMNRSNRMPPFGQTLGRAQIWALVRYLRTLCGCEAPTWSRNSP
jgi:mono/diheme cytochrome c family protein